MADEQHSRNKRRNGNGDQKEISKVIKADKIKEKVAKAKMNTIYIKEYWIWHLVLSMVITSRMVNVITILSRRGKETEKAKEAAKIHRAIK
eukprot:2369741-Ditylum_brightwellii.AAC.1